MRVSGANAARGWIRTRSSRASDRAWSQEATVPPPPEEPGLMSLPSAGSQSVGPQVQSNRTPLIELRGLHPILILRSAPSTRQPPPPPPQAADPGVEPRGNAEARHQWEASQVCSVRSSRERVGG
ncbi:hypothetical protein MG293_020767 [Ovis ammon polii]|uniref:Uncharacterized protein n=1 Tax=Ovis ammon polii TaxID=230172 RepID=A0AAD4XZH1_OVIAM|nr:hypothetical protein MG293_020767 [Ovis ammon polii]